MSDPIIAYKAFNADFSCREFQYEVGKTYTHEGAVEICSSGFHACTNPMDVWRYYDLIDTRYAIVEMRGTVAKHDDEDTKIASAEITIKAELKLPEFIKAAVQFIVDLCKDAKDERVQAASGNYAQLAASGNSAQLAASGNYAQLAASGNYAQLAASGYYAKLAASGNSAQLAASGNSAQLAASGKDSVIASSSIDSVAKGAEGTWIALAEFNDGKCVGFATGKIGDGGLKPDTYYRAKGGKLVEVSP